MELNLRHPRTNPESNRVKIFNRGPPDHKPSPLTTLPHCLLNFDYDCTEDYNYLHQLVLEFQIEDPGMGHKYWQEVPMWHDQSWLATTQEEQHSYRLHELHSLSSLLALKAVLTGKGSHDNFENQPINNAKLLMSLWDNKPVLQSFLPTPKDSLLGFSACSSDIV